MFFFSSLNIYFKNSLKIKLLVCALLIKLIDLFTVRGLLISNYILELIFSIFPLMNII